MRGQREYNPSHCRLAPLRLLLSETTNL